jgi:Fe-S cluster assembly protein SufD
MIAKQYLITGIVMGIIGVGMSLLFRMQLAWPEESFKIFNILLGDKATINAKPQLEIFADDVKCSHGCTIGQLDESAMFYMQQRGIPKKEAKALLMYAFTSEVTNSVKIPELKAKIARIIADKLGVNMGFDL